MGNLLWLNLQQFADGAGNGGDGGAGEAAAESGVNNAPDAEESRLRELGVPENVLAKRAKRAKASPARQETQQPMQQDASVVDESAPEGSNAEAPSNRMSWEEIMADPEYNKQMQSTIQARLRSAKGAEEQLSKLAPAIELLARKYGLDPENVNADELSKAISDDDSYYEDKALEMGVPIETAKKIDQNERENARRQAEEARTAKEQAEHDHYVNLMRQAEELKKIVPDFDLLKEAQTNPAFARMTSQFGGVSVEDAYFAVHRKEMMQAGMQATMRQATTKIANAIRSGQSRPVENGTSAQAPSVTSFDYAHASKEQREALKRQIRDAAAHGVKLYPGQQK